MFCPGAASSLGSTKPFGEARDAEAPELELLDRFEAFTLVEGGGGCVLRAGLNDRAFGCGLGIERAADEGGCDAAAEVRGMDDQAVDVDRVGADTPGDRTHELSFDERAEELLAARSEFLECFPERWNPVRADQLGLDSVCEPLQLQNCLRGFAIGDVNGDELTH